MPLTNEDIELTSKQQIELLRIKEEIEKNNKKQYEQGCERMKKLCLSCGIGYI